MIHDAHDGLFRVLYEQNPGNQVWQGLLERSVLVRDCSGWLEPAGQHQRRRRNPPLQYQRQAR